MNESVIPTALITGASFGLGREFARIHAKQGGRVILVARNAAALEALKNELIRESGVQAAVIVQDLSQAGAALRVYEAVNTLGWRVDYLINNAGFGAFGFYWETSFDKEAHMMQVNMVALAQLSKLYLKEMVARRSGRIMNVASLAAFQPGPLMAMYYATKAFVLSFSEALAEEAHEYGVSVTALCPGPTHTKFAQNGDLQHSKLMHSLPVHSAAHVAQYGYEAMLAGKRLAIHGLLNKILAHSTRLSPRALSAKFARHMQRKDSA